MQSPFYIASVVLLKLHECVVSHMQVLATTLLSVHNIRECGSTLYVGLARAVSPTNTSFRLTFLLTRLQEALYEGLAV